MKDNLTKAMISIKDNTIVAQVEKYFIRISNLKYFPELKHGDIVGGKIFHYDEINGERSFNKTGKHVRFKIIRIYEKSA